MLRSSNIESVITSLLRKVRLLVPVFGFSWECAGLPNDVSVVAQGWSCFEVSEPRYARLWPDGRVAFGLPGFFGLPF